MRNRGPQIAIAVSIAAAVALVGSALSGFRPGAASAASGHTLRLALSADPAPLDPDTYYEAEGLAITTSTYEGLLRYKPNSPRLEGLLATSWKVSRNGRTYTFALRHGVRFSDGTPFAAAAAKASFQRRVALKGGPSYMLAGVASITTPGRYTLRVRLKQPVAPFLDYLASPYGPLMTSPTAVRTHAVGGDMGAKWLASHSAGTGPYVLTKVQRSVLYELQGNPYYWGTKPYFNRVDFAIVPDFTTQRLKLEGGDLDMVLHGLTTEDVQALAKNSKFQVKNFPSLFKAAVWVNPASKALGDPKTRAALRAALDNATLTKSIYGPRAVASTQTYPAGMLPNGAAPDRPRFNPALLKTALVAKKGQSVSIGWYADGAMGRLADLVQIQLQSDGLKATTQELTPTQVFALPTKPTQRPDLFMGAFNPDAAHPDTWARIYYYKNAPVNFMGCSVPRADRLLDRAVVAASRARSERLEAQAAIAYRNSNCWLNVSDVRDTIVARKGITGWDHQLPWVFVTRLASLREG